MLDVRRRAQGVRLDGRSIQSTKLATPKLGEGWSTSSTRLERMLDAG